MHSIVKATVFLSLGMLLFSNSFAIQSSQIPDNAKNVIECYCTAPSTLYGPGGGGVEPSTGMIKVDIGKTSGIEDAHGACAMKEGTYEKSNRNVGRSDLNPPVKAQYVGLTSCGLVITRYGKQIQTAK